MHPRGSEFPQRNRWYWTAALSGLAAAAIGLSVVGDARAIDQGGDLRGRAARAAAPKAAPRNANAPAPAIRPRAMAPAVGNPNRPAIQPGSPQPNPAQLRPTQPRELARPAVNDPRHPAPGSPQGATGTPEAGGTATNPRNRLNAAVDPRSRLGKPNDPTNRPNGATDSRGRPNIDARDRLNPNDPRNRLNAGGNDPRNRLNAAADPRNRLNGAMDPRGRFNQALDHRSRLNAALEHRRLLLDHRRVNFLAQSRLPFRPYFGERGFTGVPPVSETRYVTNEMVFHVGSNVTREQVDSVARKLNLSIAGSESMSLTGGTMFHVRVAGGRSMTDVVRALEAEKLGLAQPNYVFYTQRDPAVPQDGAQPAAAEQSPAPPADGNSPQETTLAARPARGDPSQYVVNKLKLGEAHRVATGSNVLVAVIDSQIDTKHPDLAASIVEQYDAVGRADKPDAHGTGMAGAIAAQRKLLGVAPGAKILAIHAFSPDSTDSPQATTKHILAGLEYAIKRGARVINMSFAGPYDPVLQLAIKKARDKGVVMIAAAGNAGPKSPPLYPGADPNVIAVTATDANDKIFAKANRGPQVALAAPGVEILEPAPNGGYQLTTGTSVAAAHVSGVAALLIERHPTADPAAIQEILTMSAKRLAANGRDDESGWGLVDPTSALNELDAKVARDKDLAPGKPATAQAQPAATKPATGPAIPAVPATPRQPPTTAQPAASRSGAYSSAR